MGLKTLHTAAAVDEIRQRILSLSEADTARWGKMSVREMVCHLADSFGCPLGTKAVGPMRAPMPVPIYKWLALTLPVPWPKGGVETAPEMKQGVGGRPPAVWEGDLALLLAAFEAFVAKRDGWGVHPQFKEMSTAEWMRWGYLHADHHLRQFGR